MKMRPAVIIIIVVAEIALLTIPTSEATFNLTLIHTGQTFDEVTAVDTTDNPCELVNGTYVSSSEPCLGGMDRRSTVINQARQWANNSLLIDSGGLFTGSTYWYLYNSSIAAKYFNLLGYEAIGLSLCH